MKKCAFLFFTCLFIASYLSAKDSDKSSVTLKGNITHRLSDSIYVSYLPHTDATYKYKKYYSKIDANGNFSLTFPVVMPYTDVTIEHGNQVTSIIVAPGNDLVMSDDAHNFDSSLTFSGKGAEIQNLLARHAIYMQPMNAYGVEVKSLYIKEPAEFKQSLAAAAKKNIDYLEKNKVGIPTSFIAYWKTFYEYENYYSMLTYPWRHEINKRKTFEINMDSIAKDVYAVSLLVPEKFNDELLAYSPYEAYIREYYTSQINARGKAYFAKDTTEKDGAIALKLAYEHLPTKTSEFYAAHHISAYSKYLSLAEIEEELKVFKAHYPNSSYSSELEDKLITKKKMSPGMPAIDFAINTPEGKKMNLSDLKGKVVYVDFWASWCGPCVKEMPPAKKIREQFKDKSVAFVYVSIDDGNEAWMKGVKKYELASALNTRVSGAFQANEVLAYGINGIPAYFVIDKNGNFATDKQIRPSDGNQLETMINKLLE